MLAMLWVSMLRIAKLGNPWVVILRTQKWERNKSGIGESGKETPLYIYNHNNLYATAKITGTWQDQDVMMITVASTINGGSLMTSRKAVITGRKI